MFSSLFLLLLAGSQYASAQQPDRGGLGLPKQSKDGRATEAQIYTGSYALLIGVSDYTEWPRLPGVREDIRAVRDAIERHGFKVDEVYDPTRRDFRDAVETFIDRHGLNPDHRLLLYFAGHGHTETLSDSRQMGYLVMKDAPSPRSGSSGFRQRIISMDDIEAYARRIESRHALFVFDSCFSGTMLTRSADALTPFVREMSVRPVRQFITSGAADQEVPDRSVFRALFVRGIEGEADQDRDGYVMGSELAYFLQKQVTDYSRQTQTPQYGKIKDINLDRGDFIFIASVKPIVERNSKSGAITGTAANSLSTSNTAGKPALPTAELVKLMEELYSKHDYSSLDKAVDVVLSLDPDNALALRLRGAAIHYKRRDRERFEVIVDKVLSELQHPRDAREYEARGWAYLYKKDSNRSIVDLEEAIRLDPQFALAYLTHGDANCFVGDYDRGIASYNEALRLNPRFTRAYVSRGVAYRLKRDYDAGIKDFDEAIRLDPNDVSAYGNRGLAYRFKKDYETAIKDFSEIIRLDPAIPEAYIDRGYSYSGKRDYDRAMADFNQAISLDPKNAWAYSYRGDVYANKNNFDHAITDFTEAIRLNPTLAHAYTRRAAVYRQIKRDDLATADVEMVRKLQAEAQNEGKSSVSTMSEPGEPSGRVKVLVGTGSGGGGAATTAAGTWTLHLKFRQAQRTQMTTTLTLQSGGSGLVGEITLSKLNTIKLRDAQLNGNELTFSYVDNLNGKEYLVTARGTIDGNAIRGTMTTSGQEVDFTGTRTPRGN